MKENYSSRLKFISQSGSKMNLFKKTLIHTPRALYVAEDTFKFQTMTEPTLSSPSLKSLFLQQPKEQ